MSETYLELEEGDLTAFRADLLGWFVQNKRDLPWRGASPYAVWVSEVMLQQTQVVTVIDYYRRWLERFPDVQALAAADVDAVLEAWAGLGYYRRARLLHKAARIVVAEHGGELPRTASQLRKLPGVGPYTAGAIASIAFEQPAALVDGNVARVLARLFAIAGDPRASASQKAFWSLATELVDPNSPGDFNQGLMELGSMVCTPRSPSCGLCPVQPFCAGYAAGDPEQYPSVAKRARQRSVEARTVVVVAGQNPKGLRFLVVKRPIDGLLGGLWEFPTVEAPGNKPLEAKVLSAYLADTLGAVDASEAKGERLGELTHHFSHIKMQISAEVRRVSLDAAQRGPRDVLVEARWVSATELRSLAMSAAMRKVERLYQSDVIES